MGHKMNIFAKYISEKLAQKQKQNPSYSLRSFSRDLEIDPSSLSKIIAGKRIPDMATVRQILTSLKEDQASIESICSKIEQEKNIKDFKLATPKKDFKKTPEVVFDIISDPLHYTFLEALKLNQGQLDLNFFTDKLEVSRERLEKVIDNLIQVELIEVNENRIIDNTSGFSSHEIGLEQTNQANKQYQRSLLDFSKDSIEKVPMEARDHSAILFATNQQKIYEAKGIIKKFRQSLCEFLEDVEDKDTVYALQVSLFPLTRDED